MYTTKSRRKYFSLGVDETSRVNNREYDEEDITVRIGEGSEFIIFVLSGCVPALLNLYHKPKLIILLSTLTVAA